MPSWDEVHARARKLIDEGLRLLKSGVIEAEFLAEATASAAKLHYSVRKNKVDKYTALHELGKIVLAAMDAKPEGRQVPVTDEMKSISSRVHRLEQDTKETEAKISSISVVKKEPVQDSPTPPSKNPPPGEGL